MDYQEKMRVFGTGIVIGAFLTALPTITFSVKNSNEQHIVGIEQGRAEATSNLVSVINTLTEKSRKELFLRANGVANNEGLTLGEKIGYLSSSFDNMSQLERIRREIEKDAKAYASGEKKANTNEGFVIPSYDLKINL